MKKDYNDYEIKSRRVNKYLLKIFIEQQRQLEDYLELEDENCEILENLELMPFEKITEAFGLKTMEEKENFFDKIGNLIQDRNCNLDIAVENFIDEYIE